MYAQFLAVRLITTPDLHGPKMAPHQTTSA